MPRKRVFLCLGIVGTVITRIDEKSQDSNENEHKSGRWLKSQAGIQKSILVLQISKICWISPWKLFCISDIFGP